MSRNQIRVSIDSWKTPRWIAADYVTLQEDYANDVRQGLPVEQQEAVIAGLRVFVQTAEALLEQAKRCARCDDHTCDRHPNHDGNEVPA